VQQKSRLLFGSYPDGIPIELQAIIIPIFSWISLLFSDTFRNKSKQATANSLKFLSTYHLRHHLMFSDERKSLKNLRRNKSYVLSRVKWLDTGFGLVIEITRLLKLVTTSNYSAIANSYTLYNSLKQALKLFSRLCLHWLLLDNSSQRRRFLISRVLLRRSSLASVCLTAHGRNSWPLSPSRVWPLLATAG
jgi:hypothetical protein